MNCIKEWRKKRGMTQRELAVIAGVSQNAVSQWETGRSDPSVALYPLVADALRTTVEELSMGKQSTETEKEPQNSVELTAAEKRLFDTIRELPEDRRDVACLTAELAVRGKVYRDLLAKLDEVSDMAERIMGNGSR